MQKPLTLMQVALGDLEYELEATRRLLARVPDEHLAWKPHEKSMSLGALSIHIVNLLHWQSTSISEDAFDLAALPPERNLPKSCDALLRLFDENRETLRATIAQTAEADLQAPWQLKRGDHVVFTRPRAAVLRNLGISHMIHHRGQLTVYLRLLGVPLPPIYGPTADERMAM